VTTRPPTPGAAPRTPAPRRTVSPAARRARARRGTALSNRGRGPPGACSARRHAASVTRGEPDRQAREQLREVGEARGMASALPAGSAAPISRVAAAPGLTSCRTADSARDLCGRPGSRSAYGTPCQASPGVPASVTQLWATRRCHNAGRRRGEPGRKQRRPASSARSHTPRPGPAPAPRVDARGRGLEPCRRFRRRTGSTAGSHRPSCLVVRSVGLWK
jgi:hypothetical protein